METLALPHQSSGADMRAALHSEGFTLFINCNIPLSCGKERPCGRATFGREKGASTQLLFTAWEVFYIKMERRSFPLCEMMVAQLLIYSTVGKI